MNIYTVFCTDEDTRGDSIQMVECVEGVFNPEAAAVLGRELCAEAWNQEPESIKVLGVAEGYVNVLLWSDEGLELPEAPATEGHSHE